MADTIPLVLTVIGIILEVIGAVRIGWNDIMDREKAAKISAAHLDENPHAIEELLRRSKNSRIGLALIVVGSMLLVVAALYPTIATQGGTP